MERSSCIKKISSYKEILNILREFDLVFIPSISTKVLSLEKYALKLFENAIIIAYYMDNKIVGFASLYANDNENKTAYISYIGVIPSFQKKRIGSDILNECIKYSIVNGMNKIKLEVNINNHRAIDFYHINGFKTHIKSNNDALYLIKYI